MDHNNSDNFGVYNTTCCYLCQKDGLECDGKRPCSACITRNSPHMCMGLELEQQSNRLHEQNWQSTYNIEETSQRKRKKRSKNKDMAYDHLSMHPENHYYDVNSQFLNEQEKINMYMLNEIRNIKQDHDRLNNEIAFMKDENRKLHGILTSIFGNGQILNQLAQSMRSKDSLTETVKLTSSNNAIAHTQDPRVKWKSNPLVVFDLSQSQASVITANEEFCDIFGYTIDEVRSMNWAKFIHPDYVERTKTILINSKGNNVRFKQVYVNKYGKPFVSNDTHTLIMDQNGNIKADVVQTIPEKTPIDNIKEYLPHHYEIVNNQVEEKNDVINDDFWLNDEYIDQFNFNEQM